MGNGGGTVMGKVNVVVSGEGTGTGSGNNNVLRRVGNGGVG